MCLYALAWSASFLFLPVFSFSSLGWCSVGLGVCGGAKGPFVVGGVIF